MPLITKGECFCVECKGVIPAGSSARPIHLEDGLQTEWNWAHCICVPPTDERVKACKHWINKGSCLYHSTCAFRHTSTECGMYNTGKRRERGDRYRRPVSNDGRVGVLRRWLVRTFGTEYLDSGSGVLVVADGKGELAFELVNLNNTKATVYDPRSLILDSFVRKIRLGFYYRNDVLCKYNTSTPSVPFPSGIDASNVNYKSPSHIRGYFEMKRTIINTASSDSELRRDNYNSLEDESHYEAEESDDTCVADEDHTITCLPIMLHNELSFTEGIKRGLQTQWSRKGLFSCQHDDQSHEHETIHSNDTTLLTTRELDDISTQHISDTILERAMNDITIDDNVNMHSSDVIQDLSAAINIVNNVSMVVGMHADQATEHIIDFALSNKKPFAVVPCCVYASYFPARKLSNGSQVSTYEDLIQYLMEKDSGIGKVELAFEGRNILLYHLGSCHPLVAPQLPEQQIVNIAI